MTEMTGKQSSLSHLPAISLLDEDNAHVPDRTTISVIIPVVNEEHELHAAIRSAMQASGVEVIVVDGGSTDATVETANRLGAHVVHASPLRAIQMNAGISAANGEILLFLHADTRLPAGYDNEVTTLMQRSDVAAGAFRIAFDRVRLSLRLIEYGTNLRSRWLQMPYGDQAIFLRAETMSRIGAYRELSVMEDFDLMRRLRRLGRIELTSAAVTTSARRWRKLGVWRATWTNQLCILAHLLGVPCHRIARWRERTDR